MPEDLFVLLATLFLTDVTDDAETHKMEALDGPQCWGGVLKCDNGRGCDPFFRRGRRHM